MKRESTQPLGLRAAASPTTENLGKTTVMDRWLVRKLLHVAGKPPIGLKLWDGQEYTVCAEPVRASATITDRAALYKLAMYPDLELGELYSAGRFRVDGDLTTFLIAATQNLPHTNDRLLPRLLSKLYLLKANSLNRAKENIYHHYDISNAFYQLWLDQRMLYTCAYFPTAETTLEDAQLAKMHHVCRKLRLQPGESVVEAGCGWGALALHMAKHYGVNVKAYNISKEQLAYAREQAKAEGLQDQVEFIEGDYRQISGTFDAFVSVGMLEHVGIKHFNELGQVIDTCLPEHGRGLIHSIGRNRRGPMNAWIEKRIFPGAYPPTLAETADIFEPWEFSVLDVENLRLHYAETLRHWLARFEQNSQKVRDMFDEAFVRAWRLYLAGSVATFEVGDLQLFQILFNRKKNNDIPATRQFIYQSH